MAKNTITTREQAQADAFFAWATRRDSERGQIYAEGSIRQYRSALRNYWKRLEIGAVEAVQVERNLFVYRNVVDFDAAVERLKTIPAYEDAFSYENDHNDFNSAIKIYREYLNEEGVAV